MSSDQDRIPEDWDALTDREIDAGQPAGPPTEDRDDDRPQTINVLASSWADLVSLLAICTAALGSVLVMGERPSMPALWWAALLALLWWVVAAAALVLVRQGTPGMLLAGIRFDGPVQPDRVGRVLMAALLGVATLGLTGIVGDGALLRAAGGAALKTVDGIA
jgi:hypothetical protein